jgi:acetyl esterase/lipase
MSPVRHTYTYKIIGDCKLRADVHAIEDGPNPIIVWLHGGALIMGNRILPDRYRDLYLNGGYTVVSVDYRLAPETKLPAIVGDLRDACQWIREEGPGLFNADAQSMAVIGHSAGGYLALMAGLVVKPPPRALVSFYGYGDIIGAWYSQPDPFYCKQPSVSREEAYSSIGSKVISGSAGQDNRERFYLYCRQQGLWPKEVGGHDPHTEPEFFHPFRPLHNINADYPPTMLLHGDNDTDVPYGQSLMMVDALSRAGVECELVSMPHGSHGFDFLADDREFSEISGQVLKFVEKHLR